MRASCLRPEEADASTTLQHRRCDACAGPVQTAQHPCCADSILQLAIAGVSEPVSGSFCLQLMASTLMVLASGPVTRQQVVEVVAGRACGKTKVSAGPAASA